MKYGMCILGWHFLEEFYHRISQIACDKYIICHRDRDFTEELPLSDQIKNNLFFCPNIGLDWGGYHQFNELGRLRNYDFVIYCHDDLEIKDIGFVQAIAEIFEDETVKVVGNGHNGTDTRFSFAKYKNRMFFEDEDDFVVKTVRGSFFAARTEIFSRIGNFPVFWKTEFKPSKKGNISLRNFAYLVTKHFGERSITYLEEDSWLETKYLMELRRGELHPLLAQSG